MKKYKLVEVRKALSLAKKLKYKKKLGITEKRVLCQEGWIKVGKKGLLLTKKAQKKLIAIDHLI